MTDATGAQVPAETSPPGPRRSPLGVVDPMRLPIPAWLRQWWAALPMIGRVFVGLALLDLVGRGLGALQPPIHLVFGPTALVASILPRTLVILFPAILLTRRTDVDRATPLVFRGALLIALVELIGPQVINYVGTAGGDAMVGWTVISILIVVLKAAAWIAIALGLAALASGAPGPFFAGLANILAGGIVALALLRLFVVLTGPTVDLGDPGWNQLQLVASSFFVLESFALAYLARVVIRGGEDSRRPRRAVELAVAAFAVVGTVAIVDLVLGIGALARTSFGLAFIPMFGPIEVVGAGYATTSLSWLAFGLPMSLFLAAFGLGLADTRVPSTGHDEAPPVADEPDTSWPDPEESLA